MNLFEEPKLPNYLDFKNNGKLIGTGSFKQVYKLGNYIMAEVLDKEDKWCRNQLFKQIEIWEEFKSDKDKCKLLCPILKYSYDDLYYISPYCEPVTKDSVLTYSDLYQLTSDELLHYPYIEDLVLEQNQGILNGRTVVIDYGTSTEDFFQWQLEIKGIIIDLNNLKEENVRCVNVGSIFRVATVYFKIVNEKLNITKILIDDNWETTTLKQSILQYFDEVINWNYKN